MVASSRASVDADDALVLDLAQLSIDQVAAVGGKAANLGELIRAGFDVPPGFCITTEAYRRVVRGTSVEAGTSTDAPAARATVLGASFPEPVADAVRDAYARLESGAEGPVAVRSSATAEDLPGASFAGQQDTYLNVTGIDDVLDAVHRCWASLWTDRAVAYRAAQGIDGSGVALAVVVQRMVDAESAGVLFTADPVTGRRRQAVLDAARGLGDAVVSGAVVSRRCGSGASSSHPAMMRANSASRSRSLTTGASGPVAPADRKRLRRREGPSRWGSSEETTEPTDPRMPRRAGASVVEFEPSPTEGGRGCSTGSSRRSSSDRS